MLVSARVDLLGRLGKSTVLSLLALPYPSHTQCYKMRSQTVALLHVTAPYSPGALEFRGFWDCSLAVEHNTQCAVSSAFPLQTSFELHVTLSHFSNSAWHFLCLRLISWCGAFTKLILKPVNNKCLCQHLFFSFFFSLYSFYFKLFLILRARFSAGAYNSQPWCT